MSTSRSEPLSIDDARALAQHWASRRASGRTPEFSPDEPEALLGWVRAYVTELAEALAVDWGGSIPLTEGQQMLAIRVTASKLEITVTTASALIDVAGWPS